MVPQKLNLGYVPDRKLEWMVYTSCNVHGPRFFFLFCFFYDPSLEGTLIMVGKSVMHRCAHTAQISVGIKKEACVEQLTRDLFHTIIDNNEHKTLLTLYYSIISVYTSSSAEA